MPPEPRAVPVTRQYQTIGDTKGGSDSKSKLQRLRLHLIGPLAGKSVLDLGCNEGFFCGIAMARGARRVVGIDRSPLFIRKARARYPGAEFVAGSWWTAIPDVRFDVIFFLSAIHYEPDQRALLDRLADHLAPGGVLVLECGLASSKLDTPSWIQIQREGDTEPRRYPTLDYLTNYLMPGYVVTGAGASVMQKGDPVQRWVLHCRRRQPVVLIVTGQSGDGKSAFAQQFQNRDIPIYRTDPLFHRLISDPLYRHVALAIALRETGHVRCEFLSEAVAQNPALIVEFCDIVCGEAPLDAPSCILEGEAFRHPAIMAAIGAGLTARGAKVWEAEKNG